MRRLTVLFAAVSLFGAAPLHAQYATYDTRTSLEAMLNTQIVDDYSTGYGMYNTDAEMSAVRGETRYTSTAYTDWNVVFRGMYCAGCNGSFRMDFGSTSVSSGGGVYGVGFDHSANSSSNPFLASVVFGDGSSADLAINAGGGFFGLTSVLGIASIHIGLANGVASAAGYFVMDNLLIGDQPAPPVTLRTFRFLPPEPTSFDEPFVPGTTVPEPSTVVLLAAGLAGMGLAARRRRQAAVAVSSVS